MKYRTSSRPRWTKTSANTICASRSRSSRASWASQDTAAEAETYRKRVLDLHLPQECEDKLIREVDRFAKLGGSNAEQGVVRTYLDTVLDLPGIRKAKSGSISPRHRPFWIATTTA